MAGAGTTSASDGHLNELVISIESRFVGLSRPSDCCIFAVPERLRRTNQDAYTPRVVAIGPYHHDDPSLRPMEAHKLWYLRNFLAHNENCCLKDYIERVKSWEDEARNCYDKEIDLNSNQFAEMMLLDGIFVIQLFRMLWEKSQSRLHGNWIFDKPGMLDDVCRDMALLENQMPFFAIHRLFEMAFEKRQEDMPGLLELACGFFKSVMRMEKLPDSEVKRFVNGIRLPEVKHFVDVIRLSFLPSVKKVQNEGNKEVQNESNKEAQNESPKEMKNTRSATELVAAGVKLRRDKSKCLFSFLPSVKKVQNEGNKEVQNESNKEAQNESPKEMKNTPSATELVAAGVKLRRDKSKCLFSFLPLVKKVQNEGNKEAQNESPKEMKNTPSATELVKAGVKLRRGDSKCLFDIIFENGVLNIPYLALDDMTESYFRNIVAFEQCYYLETYLSDYVAFMDRLVDTPGDAKLLIDNKIIENWLSDNQAVAQLMNTLSKEVGLSPESYYFYSVSDELIKHCQRPCNKWKATFKRDYCSTPWVVISVIAAVVLLLLTIVQTLCSVFSLI